MFLTSSWLLTVCACASDSSFNCFVPVRKDISKDIKHLVRDDLETNLNVCTDAF